MSKTLPNSISFSESSCYTIFLLMFTPVFYCITVAATTNRTLFHTLLFLTGFISFTFLEYIAHRFWMHGKENKRPGSSLERHMDHHRHPTELKITTGLRTVLLTVDLLVVFFSFAFDNYFTFFAGLYNGFVSYCFMHYFLHQPGSGKVFPRLQVAHIHHHCKYPDRCFGVCTVCWDRVFNTSVPREVKIPPRVIAFYFGKSGH